MKPRTDKWLKKSFDIYNERYHNCALSSSITVRFGQTMNAHDAHWDPAAREIVVNKTLETHDSLALICLHHEMAHAKLDLDGYVGGTVDKDPHHGMRFQAELDRLYKMGAYDGLL